jgi:CheY-like chemotaxis protein
MINKKKILIVDDDELILATLETALRTANYETTKCKNGKEAIEVIKKEIFDAIITDIMMPEMNGIEFVSEMRQMGVHTPVVAISGDSGAYQADENLGFACYFANEVLKKPVQKDQILKLLELAMGPSAQEAMMNL